MQKTKFKLGIGFVLMISFLYFFDDSGIFAAMICSAVVHELGHFLGIIFMGAKVKRLGLELTGAAMIYDNRHISYFGEAFIAALGPVFGLIFSIITASLAKVNEDFFIFSGVSFCLSILNLLPAQNLDGGRIIYAAMARLKDEAFADRVICLTSCLVSFVLLVLGCYILIITRGNFTILLVGVWILFDFIRVNLQHA